MKKIIRFAVFACILLLAGAMVFTSCLSKKSPSAMTEQIDQHNTEISALENTGASMPSPRNVGDDDLILAENGADVALHEHIWMEDSNPVIVDPTCTTNGYYAYTDTCSVSGCKETRTRMGVINATHILTTTRESSVQTSCTTSASYDEVTTCMLCCIEVSRETKSSSHIPGAPVVVTVYAQGCYKAGSKTTTVTCTVCNETVSKTVEIIPAKHAATATKKENVVPATCVLPGSYVLVEYCSTCGVEFSRAQNYTPATGHHFEYCDSTKCRDCDETRPAGIHTLIEKEYKTVRPTCTEDGYREYYAEYCTKCNYCSSITREFILATGHEFTDTCDATCNNAGCSFKRPFEELHNFEFDCSPKCTDCGAQNPREYHVTSGAPSCAAPIVCLVCKTVVIPTLPHTRLHCSDTVCVECGQICEPIDHIDTNGDNYCDVFTCFEHLRPTSFYTHWWCEFLNFFRRLFGLEEKCICSKK